MEEEKVVRLGISFIHQLISVSQEPNFDLLLTPENVLVEQDSLLLKETIFRGQRPEIMPTYPGYSAPEQYRGKVLLSTPVYFTGAVLYTLLQQVPPPEALARQNQGMLTLLPGIGRLKSIINSATQVDRSRRIPSLEAFLVQLEDCLPPANTGSLPLPQSCPVITESIPVPRQYPQIVVPQQPEVAYQSVLIKPTVLDEANQEINVGYTGQNVPVETAMPVPDVKPEEVTQADSVPPEKAAPPKTHLKPPVRRKPKKQNDLLVYLSQFKLDAKGIKIALGAVAGIVALVLLLLVFVVVQKARANTAFENGEYAQVISIAKNTPWLSGVFEDEITYSQAMLLKQEGKYEASIYELEQMNGFFNSEQEIKDAKYSLAFQWMRNEQYDNAIALLEEITDYKDSGKVVEKLKTYVGAEAQTSILEKYRAYLNLGDFLNSPQKVEELRISVYHAGLSRYREGQYEEAVLYFLEVEDVEEAALYLEACRIYSEAGPNASLNGAYLQRLKELSGTIDVGNILMGRQFFTLFLQGEWVSTNGGGTMIITQEGHTFDVLPFSGNYYLVDGEMRPAPQADADAKFTYIGYNEVSLTVVGGLNYTFKRN